MTTRTLSNLDMIDSEMTGSYRTDLDMINSDLTDKKRTSWQEFLVFTDFIC